MCICTYRTWRVLSMKKCFKKGISVLLAIVMLFMIAVPVFAEGVDKTPVVVIPGVLNTPIIRENGQQVLLPDFSNLSDEQIEQIIGTLKYILKLQDNHDYAGATQKLIDLLYEHLDGAACNRDGTSKYPTHVIKNYNNYNTENEANEAIGREIAKTIGKENVYVFTYDWRGEIINIVDNELAPFIEKIKKDTGSDKVKIACVSMGGAVTSAYLNRYGYRNDVKMLSLFRAPLPVWNLSTAFWKKISRLCVKPSLRTSKRLPNLPFRLPQVLSAAISSKLSAV